MTEHHQVIHDAIAALRLAADRARQSEASDRRWEGEYDLLTHHAEMLEGVLMNTQAAPQETQGAECTPGATQGALVVTGDAVECAVDTFESEVLKEQDYNPLHAGVTNAVIMHKVLTAALPLAKTEAEVRAEWTEKLARWVSDGYAGGGVIADQMRDFARSQAGGGE